MNVEAAAEWVRVSALSAWAKNPRSDQPVEEVARSIVRFGFGAPVLARAANGEVIAGHTRLKAVALLREWWASEPEEQRAEWSADARRIATEESPCVPVRRLDLSEKEAHALALADNRIDGAWDDPKLSEVLRELATEDFDLSGLGFDSAELDSLLSVSLDGIPGAPGLPGAPGAPPGAPGEPVPAGEPVARPTLADRFGVPPFSVLNASAGYWQTRKRAWIAIGIASELGRGLVEGSGNHREDYGAYSPNYGAGKLVDGRPDGLTLGQSLHPYDGGDAKRAARAANATPGGSRLPAATLGKDGKTQRGDGRGRVADARTFGQDLMKKEHVVGSKRPANTIPGGSAMPLDRAKGRHTAAPGGDELAAAGSGGMADILANKRTLQRDAYASTLLTGAPDLPEWANNGTAQMAPGTSIFDPVLCELVYRWFAPKNALVFDPFTGGSVRGVVASICGHRYIGLDIRPEQLAANEAQATKLALNPRPRWELADSTKAAHVANEEPVDLVFSCPPYGDLERYSDDPADLSTMTHQEFLVGYRQAIADAVARLKPDRFGVFVVGDFRDKRGFYRNFVADTIHAFEDAGALLYNEAILVTAVGSLPIRAGKQFASGRKLGKALRNGTPVLTPTGWQAIETLQAGGEVIAADGTPTRITGVFPQGVRPLWTITFNDGASIDADSDHLWSIQTRETDWEVLSTEQIVERHGREPGDPRPRIPTCEPVQFPPRPVSINAYLVGLLLGDGGLTGNTPILTCADAEIVAGLESILPAGMQIKSRGYDHRLVGEGSRSSKNPLTLALRALGMMGKGALEKSVPEVYLWNNPETRIAILRGLMDSDGTVCEGASGTAEFSSISRRLAEDVQFLARSLGARASLSSRRPTHYIHRGERREGQPSYRVRIQGGPCPFLLSRKATPWQASQAERSRTQLRRIVSIEPAGSGEATCIAVAHPSSLFVASDFIVTHNTHQNVLVFFKGDPGAIKETFGDVEFPEDLFTAPDEPGLEPAQSSEAPPVAEGDALAPSTWSPPKAEGPEWARGFSVEGLKPVAGLFESQHKPYMLARFSRVDERAVAEAAAAGRMYTRSVGGDVVAAVSVRVARAASVLTDFADHEIGRIQPGDLRVDRFVAAPGHESALLEMLREIIGARPAWVETWQEHALDREVAALLGLHWAGTRISAASEIRGVYASGGAVARAASGLAYSVAERAHLCPLSLPPVDIAPLLAAVDRLGPAWADHYSTYNLRKSWQAVALRGFGGDPAFIAKPVEMSKAWKEEHPDALQWPVLDTPLRASLPEAEAIVSLIPGEKERVRLMRLRGGGGELARHSDITDPDAGVAEGRLLRIHVPLRTSPLVEFDGWLLDGSTRRVHMPAGSVYYLDTRKPHRAVNPGDVERIHLVMDVKSNPELLRLLSL